MTVSYIKGNIFTSKADVLVNPVNCVGVMGAGLALEFRLRYPEMYSKYIEICNKNLLNTGLLWLYKGHHKQVLNFPTKNNWKNPTKEKYLIDGLRKFSETYQDKKIKSIAFPLLGADKGGLTKESSLEIMMHYLKPLSLDVEIYEYDKKAHDDMFLKIKNMILNSDLEHISKETKIRKSTVENIKEAINTGQFYQINQLLSVNGIGVATIEKIYNLYTEKAAVEL